MTKKQKTALDDAIYDLEEGSMYARTERLRKRMLRTVERLKIAFEEDLATERRIGKIESRLADIAPELT